MTFAPDSPSSIVMRVVLLVLLLQACSYGASAVGNRPCSNVLPAVDTFYAGTGALLGAGALATDPPDHDDDHVLSDMANTIGGALLVEAALFGLSAIHGYKSAASC